VPRFDPRAKFLTGWSWLILWGVAVALALTLRPVLAIDETRYLSVAWEMWLRHDWLVPYLNGSPYSDKPPLLFWGMLLGWRIFGVNQWWPRLLPPLLGLISALLLVRLTRRLAPELPDAADRTLPFLSGLLWVTYSTLVLFDTLLTTCVLLALLGLVEVWRGGALRGWIAYAAGVGLGLLAKGPVVLIHVLPAALLAPWWTRNISPRPRWSTWYLGLLAALAVGAALALAWALTASAGPGRAYRDAILWGQTAGRVTRSFAHRRPLWWYLLAFPLGLLPWSLWPRWWRSIAGGLRAPARVTLRFGLAWVVSGFLILSLISSKQPQYLFPLLPGVALLAANALPSDRRQTAIALSLVSPLLVIFVETAGKRYLDRSDLRPVSRYLYQAEASGRPIAFLGQYAGTFHFLGRLERPFAQLSRKELPRWSAEHPTGLVIRSTHSPADTVGAVFHQPYRGGSIGVWRATAMSP
jgi:4-amino-4-deoxy-L-arabinose transferase-like glycosyltransferase